MEKEFLSVEQMTAVLDNAPIAIFVSAVDDQKLLYANQLAKEMFLGDIYSETACYKVAGFEKPCTFCHAGQMNQSELSVREYLHPINQRIYQLSGKILDWAGKAAHIEYILDITEKKKAEAQQKQVEQELRRTLGSIPSGLCVYQLADGKIYPLFHNQAFYEITGYSDENVRNVEEKTNYLGVHEADLELLQKKITNMIQKGGVLQHTYRLWNDKSQEYRWIQLEGAVRTCEDGRKLMYGVYSDAGEQKRLEKELVSANKRMQDIINAIPGGIASFRVEGERLIPAFYSDGVTALSGHSREEYKDMVHYDALDIIYELDRERVLRAVKNAFKTGEVLDISYRMRHKNGNLIWIHLNGRRISKSTESIGFYAVFTGVSAETRLFQSIANETADGIYVIDKSNYDLLYANESKNLFSGGTNCLGEKCYTALHGKSRPCEFCTLENGSIDGAEHEVMIKETGRFYSSRFRETDWNGIPAYIKFIRDITEEVHNRKEKERLEMYFKTVVDKLPGGVSVVHIDTDGSMTLEYISDGFAAMNHLTVEETMKQYEKDICAGMHPDDAVEMKNKLKRYLEKGEGHCELVGRMMLGNGDCIWVKNKLSVIQMSDGNRRLYSVYTDISRDIEEKEKLRYQYEDLILQHYRTMRSNDLILGHCNITQNRILEIIDYTDSSLLERLGRKREAFFEGMAGFVVDEKEREAFLATYLGTSMLEAFERHDTERKLNCFVKLPGKAEGCYVQIKVNLVEAPDSGDVTGIFTVTDITKQTIEDRILHQLSVNSHDYVIDLNLKKDCYKVLSSKENAYCTPEYRGRHSERVAYMVQQVIVPKDRETYEKALKAEEIRRKLKEGPYTFTYSMKNETGDIRTKNMTVFAADLRLERICLVCTDITDSVREQQGLLNMMAYTFELMGLINISTRGLVMYTRQIVLENLPPYVLDDYGDFVTLFADTYILNEDRGEEQNQFCLETMQRRLEEEPAGYDFVFQSYQGGEKFCYKQINVLWGDQNHGTICLVRADVTDMLAEEQQKKKDLERALEDAEEANRAKSDFLSAMSHDIRTPMNAIMGMTALAMAHSDDPERVSDCIQKISIASRHLLSLINDVLDMSKIERSQITLNCARSSLPELLEQLSAIMMPQAKAAGLQFEIRKTGIIHNCFYGDSLRISQILLNILSNAIKFTPEGGSISFLIEEIPAVKDTAKVRYRFTVSDSGIGMTEEFLTHIFDPFARDSKTAHIEGTGLGLSITKGLVELMEGSISVESQINKGSLFQIELECEKAPEEDVLEKKGTAAVLKKEELFSGCSFLVAEDNEINAEILCELLAMYGGRSVVKRDGLQVLQAFQEAPPGTYDAVLMDIQMPNMNGYEAARAIRGLDRQDARNIPIVAMTANAFAEDIQACLEAGMNAHVAKPIDVELLQMTLRKVLGVA